MPEPVLEVAETFASLQGESTFAGMPCFFIRLAGCNLRCRYCDTPGAYGPGTPRSIPDLVAEFAASGLGLVEITGGEPLLQGGFRSLACALRRDPGATVLVETNGSLDISIIPDGVVAIMDVKCPGSGEGGSLDPGNFDRLRPRDEVKFVIGDEADYRWARHQVAAFRLERRCHAVLFSPVWGRLDPGQLARWVMADRLSVRFQLQCHKVLGLQ